MSKTATAPSLRALSFVPRAPILASRQRTVAEALNFAAARRPIYYAGGHYVPFGYSASEGLYGNSVELNFAGWTTIMHAHVTITADVQTIVCAALANMDTGNEAEIRFTIGSASTVLTVDDTDTLQEDSLDVGTIGAGAGVFVLVEARRTVGVSTDNHLRLLEIQSGIIAATDLPDPQND